MAKEDAEYVADYFIWIVSKPSHYTALGYLLAKPERQDYLIRYFMKNSEGGSDLFFQLKTATTKASMIAENAMALRDRLVDEKFPAGRKIAAEYDKSLLLAFEFVEFLEKGKGGFDKFLNKPETYKTKKIGLFLGAECDEEKLGKILNVIERTRAIRNAMKQFEANLKSAFGAREGKKLFNGIFKDIDGTMHSQWQDSAGRTLWSPLALDWVSCLIQEQRELNVKNHAYTYETKPTKESIFERLISAADIEQWNYMKDFLYNYDGKTTSKVTHEPRAVVVEGSYKPGKSYTPEKHEILFKALNSMKKSTMDVKKAQDMIDAA
ncbi:MAG TPA: hypothetical protein PLO51_05360, partial [Candidatus Micrarchaeota archaeon]|nr:hypothetical protein [Candidatus Micrarchaeota archaeon]